MEPFLLDLQLARRIELAEAQAGAAATSALGRLRPAGDGEVARIAGGYALFCGAGSPVTQAVGIGLDGPVSDGEFARLEAFYRQRNEPVRVEACPLAHPSLFEHFGKGRYRVTEFTNVMALRLPDRSNGECQDGIQISRVSNEQLDLWNLTVAQGFSEDQPVSQELLVIMKAFALAEGVECYLAAVDGKVAGGATLSIRNGVGGLFGASTLPAFRNRGVQTSLLQARIRRAREAGCDIAACLAHPGSGSERNIVRQGFQVLYTRAKFENA